MANSAYLYALARRKYQGADAQRWQVAHIAYKTVGNKSDLHGTQKLANSIGREVDTVEKLAKAYRLFVLVVSHAGFRAGAELRRKRPYTRWAVVFDSWCKHEFSLDEAIEWLRDFEGGNKALENEIDNKNGQPEWERRAHYLYKECLKLSTDYGAPVELQKAAKVYRIVYDRFIKKVVKKK